MAREFREEGVAKSEKLRHYLANHVAMDVGEAAGDAIFALDEFGVVGAGRFRVIDHCARSKQWNLARWRAPIPASRAIVVPINPPRDTGIGGLGMVGLAP